jgi:NAD+ kinase
MMLNCRIIRKNKKAEEFIALNDAVITRGAISRMIYLKLSVDERELATFGADGVIISTPVGSTAHSLAAGGPIVDPSLKSLIITPICPHTLSMRPLVVPPEEEITVEITSKAKEVVLTIDGQIFRHLRSGDRVKVTSVKRPFYLIETPHASFYDTLRKKLNWGKREEN